MTRRKTNKGADDERKWMEERGFEYIGTASDFTMPKWMECTWRRLACGKSKCKICGKIEQDRLRHIMKGEDPDDMKSVFDDVGNNFKEALEMIRRDAKERGIDITNVEDISEPPKPKEFPLYNKLTAWHKTLNEALESAYAIESPWIYTEAAADLQWYKNTLLAKTYRQLCNRWERESGENEYGALDVQYTQYVLEECFKILKHALAQLVDINPPQKKALTLSLEQLNDLEKEIVIVID